MSVPIFYLKILTSSAVSSCPTLSICTKLIEISATVGLTTFSVTPEYRNALFVLGLSSWLDVARLHTRFHPIHKKPTGRNKYHLKTKKVNGHARSHTFQPYTCKTNRFMAAQTANDYCHVDNDYNDIILIITTVMSCRM